MLAQTVWSLSNIQVPAIGGLDISNWVAIILNVLDTSSLELFILCCWSLWRSRNDLMWDNKLTSEVVIVERAKLHLQEWKEAKSEDYGGRLNHHLQSQSMGETKTRMDETECRCCLGLL